MSTKSGIDVVGRVSSEIFSYLKRRPGLRRAAIAAFTALDRLTHHALHPFAPRPEAYRVEDSVRSWVDDWTTSHPLDPSVLQEVDGAEKVHNPPARGLHGVIDWEFAEVENIEIPPSFVLSVPGGHVVGEHGAVVTPDAALLRELSLPIGSLCAHLWGHHGTVPDPSGLERDWMLPPRRVDGTVAVLSAFVGRGYFHWMYDVLPRIGILERSGLDLHDIDKFVVPSYFNSFQIESLSTLGIPRHKVMSSFRFRHIRAERLLVPSLPREKGVVPTWACEFLRSHFTPTRPEGWSESERIYIVRKATDHGFLANEDSLAGQLAKRGFRPVAMEEFGFREKAWIMAHAKAVVGPSGGGLANIVFCPPGTTVVELRVQPYPVMEAWDIANRCELDFWDVLPEGYQRSETQTAVTEGGIPPQTVMETLDAAGYR